LQDQIDWYDRKSGSNQKAFKYLKICTISAAAIIPVLAKTSGISSSVTAGFGVFIVILEGLQQVNQYHTNWISHRSTCEARKHENSLHGKSGRIRHSQRFACAVGGPDRIFGFPGTRKMGIQPGTRAKGCPS
jgi:hypothetical protein